MQELILVALLTLNNHTAGLGFEKTGIVGPVNASYEQKYDLPVCKPVKIEVINEVDRSA